jgi:FKBP-type peptidyl-prolyl cis-trans isomerase (trigger factor)
MNRECHNHRCVWDGVLCRELANGVRHNLCAAVIAEFFGNVREFALHNGVDSLWIFEDCLTHSKKTEDDIKKDWRKDAEKRAISQILLHKIAEAEKLTATEEEVEVELVRLLATVQDANEERAKAYLYQALTNEKVLKFLEGVE